MKINLKIFFFIIQNDITKLLGISKIYSEVIRNTIETYKGLTKILNLLMEVNMKENIKMV